MHATFHDRIKLKTSYFTVLLESLFFACLTPKALTYLQNIEATA